MKLNRESITRFIKMNQRVLKVAKRPDREEYLNVSKITGIGIIIIGVVGFVITLIAQLIQY
ncbi:MAG: preprotein translocase subunit SecE [Methanobacterium sp. PtaU1.Bin242]|nr:MAG: preprotein translocase subunit SecE [Methanobacterium sp. PtaU1.Bin242]